MGEFRPSDFDWLANLHKSQCFTTCDWANPAKSTDFGSNGYTASLTDWHELLQLTAPDQLCGIVFVRGGFPDTPDAILSRSQRRSDDGSKGTFGAQLMPESEFELGERRAQGLANFRWPYMQYELKRKSPSPGFEETQTGTYELISFIKDDTFFQIIRIKPGKLLDTALIDRYRENLPGIPASRPHTAITPNPGLVPRNSSISIRLGGTVRMGCPCSNASPSEIGEGGELVVEVSNKNLQLNFSSPRYLKRLEMQFLKNGQPLEMSPSKRASNSTQSPDDTRLPTPKIITGPKIRKDVNASVLQDVYLANEEATILISSYAIRNSTSPPVLLDMSSLIGIDHYLGIASQSLEMTDRLWTACLTTNYDAIEAVEICAIAKCTEQILGVSSLPILEPNQAETEPPKSKDNTEVTEISPLPILEPNRAETESPESKDNTEATEKQLPVPSKPDTGVALIHNIMTAQYVDLQSTFWQVRLLVKVHKYLALLSFESKLLEEDERKILIDIRSLYLEKLQNILRSVLIWILKESLDVNKFLLPLAARNYELLKKSPRSDACFVNREFIIVDRSRNHTCFATMAVWYVMKHCPDAITPDFKSRILLSELKHVFIAGDRQESKGEKESTPKNDVLQWYHWSCLSLICQESFGQGRGGKTIDGYTASGLNRRKIARSQEFCEKIVKRLRKSQPGPYSLEDEEVDRLFLLGEAELKLDLLQSTTSASLAAARAAQTKTKLAERKRTSTFDPGPKESILGKSLSLTSNAPWELAFLNHHSLLRISPENLADISTRRSRDTCFEFVLSDYTFMTSWDRADSGMIGMWWDLEPSSVICATIVDLKICGKLDSAALILPIQRTITDNEQATREQAGPDVLEGAQKETLRDFILQVAQSEQGSGFSSTVFDWMNCKPNLLYHLKAWVRSLDDTPEVFKSKQTKNVVLRREIIRYLTTWHGQNSNSPPEWTLKTIFEDIPPEDLQFLSVFDLSLGKDFTFTSERMSYEEPRTLEFRSTGLSDQPRFNSPQDIPSNIAGFQRSSPLAFQRQRPLSFQGQSSLKSYQMTLLATLSDSLVDLGIKYRILFAERCCPSVVKAFIYMWHPDALDTFDNYFGSSSFFADTREALWTTTITVSHWSFRSTSATEELLKRFEEPRQNGDFPPLSIAKLGARVNIKAKFEAAPLNDIVEERSSSLVITGDSHGYNWISSIWSSLTNCSSISSPINSLPRVLQLFIHQQASGRCLVFIVLLGHLCEKLAREYEIILSRLDTVVELGEKVLLEGMDWGANDAPDKLKKMLWGLEALRVFDDRLSSSLSQIQKAKETMDHTVQQEAGNRHIELIQEYTNILEEFGKRYSILSGVQLRIKLKIRQVTGLRDGISAVTNVDDTRTTIKQGSNIRALTLITIAYLPLGFVTALFTAGHGILPDEAGTTLYVILTVVFVITTYGLALSLEQISNFINRSWEKFRDRKDKRRFKRRSVHSNDNSVEGKLSASRQGEQEVFEQGPDLPRIPRDIEAGQND